jgi:hypothetical protein
MSASEGTRSRRALTWIVVGAGVLLVAGGGLVLLTLGDDDASLVDAPTVPEPAPDAPAADAPSAVAIAVTYDILLTRDPFAPVRPPEPVAPSPADSTDPPTTSPPTTSPPTTSPPTTSTDLPIIVYEVDAQGAVVQVGDVIYDARVGETFATRYRLEAIVNGCARILDVPTGGEDVICPTTQAFK